MKRRIILMCLCLLFFSTIGKAQDSIGMIGSVPYGYKDTVQAGTIDSFTVVVKNYGSSTFNDTLTTVIAVRDSTGLLDFVGSYNTYNVILTPDDSVYIPLAPVYNISFNGYQPGINVIVIWPVAQNAITVDSLEFNVYIMDDNSVHEVDLKQLIRTFPNPAVDDFAIENNSKINIEEVRIYDVSGCLLEIIKNQSVINTDKWPEGMYLVNVLFDNQQQQSLRIIKQK